MTFSAWSWGAVAVIVAAYAIAWSRRFLAVGAIIIANLVVHALVTFGPTKICVEGGTGIRSSVQCDLSLHATQLQAGHWEGFLQVFTSMFVHANILHLLGNLVILLFFALPFEERIGHRSFVLLYTATGLVAALTQVAVFWGDPMLLLGASGAVFGIIGAFAGSFPNLVVPLPLPIGVIMMVVRMRVWIGALVFTGMQVLLFQFAVPGDNTAYLAHIGGLVFGVMLGLTVVRRMARPRTVRIRITPDMLERFAKDNAARHALEHLRQSMEYPEVYQVWLQRFFEVARSPTDGSRVHLERGAVVSETGQRFELKHLEQETPT